MKIELHPPSKNYSGKMKITSLNFTVSSFYGSSSLLTSNCCFFKFKFKFKSGEIILRHFPTKNYWPRKRKKVTWTGSTLCGTSSTFKPGPLFWLSASLFFYTLSTPCYMYDKYINKNMLQFYYHQPSCFTLISYFHF